MKRPTYNPNRTRKARAPRKSTGLERRTSLFGADNGERKLLKGFTAKQKVS